MVSISSHKSHSSSYINNRSDIVIYALELTLSLSAASYLFENTVCMFGLTDISIPRTVEAFPKCVEAIYKVLSWKVCILLTATNICPLANIESIYLYKARSCRNTKTFHGLLKKAATQLPKRKFFSPKKLSDPNLVAGVRK